MDSCTSNLPADIFRDLSLLSDGNFIIYLRNDPQNFSEIHHTGLCYPFTTTLAPFIPDVVIKLQSPLVSSYITAVPVNQRCLTLLTRTFVIVDNLPDIVSLTVHQNSAFIRENASLVVWGEELDSAFATLRQVLNELGVDAAVDSSDSVAIADHNEIDNEATSSSNTVQEAFDDFIYPYEDLTEKPHSEPTLHGALFHMETMDHVDDLAAMYTVNRMLPFDSPSPNSLALGDQTLLSHAAPSDISCQLSSTNSTDLSTTAPFGSVRQAVADNPRRHSRRLRTNQVLSGGGAVMEENRSRRVSPVSPTNVPGFHFSRTGETVSNPMAFHSPPRPIWSCRSSPSSNALRASGLKRKRASAVQLNAPRITQAASYESENEDGPEPPESDESGNHEPEASELENEDGNDNHHDSDDNDDEYRPSKRTRCLSEPTWTTTSPTSAPSTPVRSKVANPKTPSKTPSKTQSRKKKSSARGSRAKSMGPPPTCLWCDREFSRESDVLRHEKRSCKLYPFSREHKCCPLCHKEFSRDDAIIRHQGSDECVKRQLARDPLCE